MVLRTYASPVGSHTATLRAEANPNDGATYYRFEYGPEDCATSSCTSVPAIEKSLGSGTEPLVASQEVTGLDPDTTYHYRIVVTNEAGSSAGPDRWIHTFPAASGFQLPDGRAYEMVSPSRKNGLNIMASPWQSRASVDGNAVAYAASGAFGDEGGAGLLGEYIATRSPDGWITHGTTPNQDRPGSTFFSDRSSYFQDISLDLSKGVFYARVALDPQGAPNVAGNANLYIRENLREGGPSPSNGARYQLISDAVSPVTNVEDGDAAVSSPRRVAFAAATPNYSDVLFESKNNLTQDAVDAGLEEGGDGNENWKLYHWHSGTKTLTLAGILPDGTPAPESLAGQGVLEGHNLAGMLSADGSKVFFTAGPFDGQDPSAGTLYIREDDQATVRVNESERSTPDPDGPRPARFWRAARDGSRAFFTTAEDLTDDDSHDGNDLYMYDTTLPPDDPHNLTLVSIDSSPCDTCGKTENIVAASQDGDYVYFNDGRRLLPGVPALEGGARYLYVWHEGALRYVGSDISPPVGIDAMDGLRVSADGRRIIFESLYSDALGDYENVNKDYCLSSLHRCQEVLAYDYGTDETTCLSCLPTNAAPEAVAAIADATTHAGDSSTQFVDNDSSTLWGEKGVSSKYTQHKTNALLPDGSRAYFTSSQALVPEDTNGHMDVYQYDFASGQTRLISTGRCACESTFVEASPDGHDVFFTTAQRLVGIDADFNADLYDARIGGGIAAQNALPPHQCEGDACQPPAGLLNDATPASAGFVGPGDRRAGRKGRCRQARRKAGKRCMGRKRHRRHRNHAHVRAGGAGPRGGK